MSNYKDEQYIESLIDDTDIPISMSSFIPDMYGTYTYRAPLSPVTDLEVVSDSDATVLDLTPFDNSEEVRDLYTIEKRYDDSILKNQKELSKVAKRHRRNVRETALRKLKDPTYPYNRQENMSLMGTNMAEDLEFNILSDRMASAQYAARMNRTRIPIIRNAKPNVPPELMDHIQSMYEPKISALKKVLKRQR